MLFLYYPLLLLLESHQVCEELLFNELYHCTQNPLEIIEQPLMYWRGNPVLLCIHSICSKSLVALFIEPAGEYILICGWTGWPVHGLFDLDIFVLLYVLEVLALLCVLGVIVLICVLEVLVLLCVLEVLVLQCVLQLYLQQICEDLFVKIILFFYDGYVEICL